MSHVYCWNADEWKLLPLNSGLAGSANGLDRGLQFGDGLFETMRLDSAGSAPLASYHQQRLEKGMAVLGFSVDAAKTIGSALDNIPQIPFGTDTHTNKNEREVGLKLIVTRGHSAQGYAAQTDILPNIYAIVFDAPELNDQPQKITVGINPIRLGEQPLLAGLKHLNRLEQVLARQQFQPDWSESVMLNQKSQVVEGCMSNIFAKIDNQWTTPAINTAGVDGVVRKWLLSQGQNIQVGVIQLEDLASATSVCFSNSLSGFREVEILNEQPLKPSNDIAEWQMHYKSLFDER